MVQKNPFLKYLIKDKKEDVFHSSGYAKAQNGGNIGAASTDSYAVRVNVNQCRQMVRGYKDSELMNGTGNKKPKAETHESSTKENDSGTVKTVTGGIARTRAMGVAASANNTMVGEAARAKVVGARPSMLAKKPGISLKK